MNQYQKGDMVRISATFTDADGGEFDPDTVTMRYQSPLAKTATSYTYPTDSEIVKDDTGDYHLDVDTDIEHAAGDWRYDIKGKDSSDNSRGAAEGVFEVVSPKIS